MKDSSYVNEEINGEFISFLDFDVRNPVNPTINDTVECFGNKFYIRYKESVEKGSGVRCSDGLSITEKYNKNGNIRGH